MSANGLQNATSRPWIWTPKRKRGAILVAEDRLTDAEIAKECGVSRFSLFRWKCFPDFAARVNELVERFGTELQRHIIAKKERRLEDIGDRWARLRQIILERAADPAMANVPGGKTGLLVRDVKMIGSGDNARSVELYTVDTGLLKEMRECEAQVARELNQWEEAKRKIGDVQGGVQFVLTLPFNGRESPTTLRAAGITDDAIIAAQKIAAEGQSGNGPLQGSAGAAE